MPLQTIIQADTSFEVPSKTIDFLYGMTNLKKNLNLHVLFKISLSKKNTF